MRSFIIFGLLVGLSWAESGGWKPGMEYRYDLRERTMVGKDNQYNGIELKGRLVVRPVTESILSLKISKGQYGWFQGHLENTWESAVPDDAINYWPLPFTNKTFELEMKNGIVEKLSVEDTVPHWEVNMLKGIASAFQIDLKPEKLQTSDYDVLPTPDSPFGYYRTIEDTVTGKCETLYEVKPVAESGLEEKQEMAPALSDGQFLEITKSQNYTECHQKPVYHSGITGYSNWEPSSSSMGQFMSRMNLGKTVVSGSVERHILHRAEVRSKLVLSPQVYSLDKVVGVSMVKLSLDGAVHAAGEAPALAKPVIWTDLVFQMDAGRPTKPDKKMEKFLWFNSEKKTEAPAPAQEENAKSGPSLELPFSPPFRAGPEGAARPEAAASLARVGLLSPSSFMALVSTVRTMTPEEITHLADRFNSSPASWVTVRDAVAEAGTGPALIVADKWLASGRVAGEEAAQLVAQMARSPLYPSEDYLQAFYRMLSRPEIERKVRWAGMVAFGSLLRRASVDRKDSAGLYPSHLYGRPATVNQSLLFLTQMQGRLEGAFAAGDYPAIQLYSRAIGNVAHPKIISIFEPYIDGRENATDLQRLCMVASLDMVSKVHQEEAREFLYRVYGNSTYPSELRAAAVMHLMKTSPPAEMLQRMALMAAMEADSQVSSAVHSAIRTAAKLTSPRSQTLAKNAKAALGLLPQKEPGYEYSKHYIRAFETKEQNLGYKQELTYIKNDDDYLPNSIFYYIRRQMGGYKLPYKKMWAMTSSSEDLLERVWAQLRLKEADQARSFPSSWSSEKVAKMMKLERKASPPLEANLFVGLLGGYRFFPVDGSDIRRIPQVVRGLADSLAEGRMFNYTKSYNQFSMTLAYPTITGLPLVYTMNIPTVLDVRGNVQAITQPDIRKSGNKTDPIPVPDSLRGSAYINLNFSLNTQSQLGFMTPFDDKHYLVEVSKKSEAGLPVRVKAGVEAASGKAWLQVEPQQGAVLSHAGRVFTAREPAKDMGRPDRLESVKPILRAPINKYKTRIGKNMMAFDLSVESEKEMNFGTMMKWIRENDLISAWLYYYAENHPSNSNITLRFDPNSSPAQKAYFGINFDQMQVKSGDMKVGEEESQDYKESKKSRRKNKKVQVSEPEDGSNKGICSDVSPDGSKRLAQLMRDSMANIPNGEARVVNVYARFNGTQDSYYAATVAHSTSPTSAKSRLLAFLINDIENDQQIQTALDLKMNIPVFPSMNYKDALKADPTSTIDGLIDIKVNKSDWRQVVMKGEFKRSPERERYIKQGSAGRRCEIEMNDDNYLLPACRNATIAASILDKFTINFNYKEIPNGLERAGAKAYEWVSCLGFDYMREVSGGKSESKVSIGGSFSNSMRYLNLSLEAPGAAANFTNLPVSQALEPFLQVYTQGEPVEGYGSDLLQGRKTCTLDQKAVTTFENVTYSVTLDKGWHVLLQHVPRSWGEQTGVRPEISVLVRTSNSKREMKIILDKEVVDITPGEVNETKRSAYEISKLPGGVVQFNAPSYSFQALYDGSRILLQVGSKYLGEVYGYCGKSQSTFTECKLEEPCNYIKVVAVEKEGKLCFSTKPQLECAPHCQPTATAQKMVEFHCVTDSPIARHWMDMVKKGANPDFSNKGVNYKAPIEIPENCYQM